MTVMLRKFSHLMIVDNMFGEPSMSSQHKLTKCTSCTKTDLHNIALLHTYPLSYYHIQILIVKYSGSEKSLTAPLSLLYKDL